MTCSWEGDLLFVAAGVEMAVDRLALFRGDAWVGFAVHEKGGALDFGSVIDGVVGEAVEPVLNAAPEYHQFGGRKRRKAHGVESIAYGVEKGVEGALEDEGIGSRAFFGVGPQYRGSTHRHAIEHDLRAGPLLTGVVKRSGDILGFSRSKSGVAARGAARAPEIDQERRPPHPVEAACLLEEGSLCCLRSPET